MNPPFVLVVVLVLVLDSMAWFEDEDEHEHEDEKVQAPNARHHGRKGSMRLPGHRIVAWLRIAALKTHALQTLRRPSQWIVRQRLE